MGSDANRLRRIWQTYSGRNAANAENDFSQHLILCLEIQNI